VPEFQVLRTDFLSILSLIHATTTKVALALKPERPQHKAALEPLNNLSRRVAALVHLVLLMRSRNALAVQKEYSTVARNILDAILSLSSTLLSLQSSSDLSSEDYLVRTGGVHDLIDEAKKPGRLSINNRDAVKRRWQQDHESLVDALEEVKELCTAREEGDVDDVADDGWDELGLEPSQPLTPDELERAEAVSRMPFQRSGLKPLQILALIKLTTLLHKRVIADVLTSGIPPLSDGCLDKLDKLSNDILVNSDDLISSLHPPQHLPTTKSAFSGLNETISSIYKILYPPQDAENLEQRLASVNLADQPAAASKSRKWFETCSQQLDNARKKVVATLPDSPA